MTEETSTTDQKPLIITVANAAEYVGEYQGGVLEEHLPKVAINGYQSTAFGAYRRFVELWGKLLENSKLGLAIMACQQAMNSGDNGADYGHANSVYVHAVCDSIVKRKRLLAEAEQTKASDTAALTTLKAQRTTHVTRMTGNPTSPIHKPHVWILALILIALGALFLLMETFIGSSAFAYVTSDRIGGAMSFVAVIVLGFLLHEYACEKRLESGEIEAQDELRSYKAAHVGNKGIQDITLYPRSKDGRRKAQLCLWGWILFSAFLLGTRLYAASSQGKEAFGGMVATVLVLVLSAVGGLVSYKFASPYAAKHVKTLNKFDADIKAKETSVAKVGTAGPVIEKKFQAERTDASSKLAAAYKAAEAESQKQLSASAGLRQQTISLIRDLKSLRGLFLSIAIQTAERIYKHANQPFDQAAKDTLTQSLIFQLDEEPLTGLLTWKPEQITIATQKPNLEALDAQATTLAQSMSAPKETGA